MPPTPEESSRERIYDFPKNEINSGEPVAKKKRKRCSVQLDFEDVTPPPNSSERAAGFCCRPVKYRGSIQDLAICTNCYKAFGSVNTVKIHRRVHTGEVHYCSQCSKSFPVKANLIAHLRTHTKPFQCDHCGRRFSQSSGRNAHQFRCPNFEKSLG